MEISRQLRMAFLQFSIEPADCAFTGATPPVIGDFVFKNTNQPGTHCRLAFKKQMPIVRPTAAFPAQHRRPIRYHAIAAARGEIIPAFAANVCSVNEVSAITQMPISTAQAGLCRVAQRSWRTVKQSEVAGFITQHLKMLGITAGYQHVGGIATYP